MLLADMGAEIIRVESTQHFPPITRGDLARPARELLPSLTLTGRGYPDADPGERPWNRVALFNCHARNKRSVTVDLQKPEGRALVKRLVQISDGVIENNSVGVMASMGLDYENLKRIRPDLIMVSLTGMGQTGPYRSLRGFGMHFEDVAGHHWLRGYEDGDMDQARGGIVPSDSAAGAALVLAFMAAVFHRRRTGEGQYIDISMAEAFMGHLGPTFLDYTMNGRSQRSTGNRSSYAALQGVYPCRGEDAWVALTAATDTDRAALAGLIGRPDLTADAQGRPLWGEGAEAVWDAAISTWTLQHGADEALALLQAAGVAAGRTMDERVLYQDAHLDSRGFYQWIDQKDAGLHRYPVQLYQASKTPILARRPPVLLGEDNNYLYRDLFGLDSAEIEALIKAGHIGEEFDSRIP